jgi:hypothetical protein
MAVGEQQNDGRKTMPKPDWIERPRTRFRQCRPVPFWRAAVALLLFCLPQAAGADMIAEGRAIVAEHCTRCHVVPEINPKGGIESTPSFKGMKHLADWRRRFEVFYTLPPHPALVSVAGISEERDKSRPAFVQEIKLSVDDIDRILAYVDTIEK